jgi:hypothetical protein
MDGLATSANVSDIMAIITTIKTKLLFGLMFFVKPNC